MKWILYTIDGHDSRTQLGKSNNFACIKHNFSIDIMEKHHIQHKTNTFNQISSCRVAIVAVSRIAGFVQCNEIHLAGNVFVIEQNLMFWLLFSMAVPQPIEHVRKFCHKPQKYQAKATESHTHTILRIHHYYYWIGRFLSAVANMQFHY